MNIKSKKYFWLIYLGLIMFFLSCKKEKTKVDHNYLITSNGSTWDYEGILIDHTFHQMTGDKKMKFGKTYFQKQVTVNNQSSFYWAAVDGKNYYTIVSSPNDESLENEILYLKSDAEIGESWSNNITFGSEILGTSWDYKIIEKGISKKIKGKNYNDVIHTERTSYGQVIHTYYAHNVGLIEESYSNGAIRQLVNFSVK